MRLSVAVTAICLSIIGLSEAAEVRASMIRKPTQIPAESLGAALQALAKDRNFQIIYVSEEVNKLHTAGAVGEFTPDEALKQLLKGTGLTYRYLDERTVTVLPVALATSDAGAASTASRGGAQNAPPQTIWSSFLLAQATTGQTQGPATQGTVGGSSTAGFEQLQEVLVTAQKREERLQDVPMSISVLGGHDLDRSNFVSITDALNTVPGVAAFANPTQEAGTTLSIRGVSAAGPFAFGPSTVAYYVDGVPFGMVRTAIVPDPTIYDLSRVEVLRGPQGTLYGANALNGVVRVLTFDPDVNNFDFKARGSVSTTEEGGGNYSGDMAVNLPIVTGALAARLTVGDSHQSGWIDGPLGNNLNSGDLSNVRGKIAWEPTDTLHVGLSAWHSQSNYDGPSESDANYQNTAIMPQPMHSHFNAYDANVVYQLPVVSISSVTSYVDYASNNASDLHPVGFDEIDQTNLTSRVFAEELNLTSRLEGPWAWSVGLFYRDAKDTTYQFFTPYPTGSSFVVDDFRDTSRSEAIYGELRRRFFDNKFEWTLGARYFRDDAGTLAVGPLPGQTVPPNEVKATSSATTPRAVLRWLPSRDLSAYVSYSQGFRSGLPQDELVGAIVQDFPALKPDKLTNYEAGVKGSVWDQRLSYEAAIFYMDWKDIQQAINVPATVNGTSIYVFALVNGQSASGEGAEFSVTARPVDGLTLGANFGWNNLHFNGNVYSGGALIFAEGDRPDFSPEYTAGVSAQYAFPISASGIRGVFSAAGNYISPLNTTNLAATPSTPRGNSLLLTRAAFNIEFPQHWSCGLFVENANNYNGTQVVLIPSIPQYDSRVRPRTYGVRVDYHFQ